MKSKYDLMSIRFRKANVFLRACDRASHSPNALFNTACLNCPQRFRLALTVAST